MRRILLAAAAICVVPAGSGPAAGQDAPPPAPAVIDRVTADIQAGIEKHIEEQARAGEGYFRLHFSDRDLRLKLVRVHLEYLSKLGPHEFFACVDLADVGGDVFDIDFFLHGDPGAMAVTETTVHKINGQPYYLWDQDDEGEWHRIPVEEGKDYHLGILKGRDEFEFVYRATLPEIPGTARLWMPVPSTDEFQTVEVVSISVPGNRRMLEDREYHNKVLFTELGSADGGKTLEARYKVRRAEKAACAPKTPDAEKFLGPETRVPADGKFAETAKKVLEGKKGDLVRARALYDHVIDRMKYMKYGSGWGQGDALYACDAKSGNCTDFHAYFIALARASGIPARFAIGASIPSDRNEGGIDGYHCWAEFFAEGKWWPIDISEADKYASLCTYYFGHHPANRLEFSRGRDLVVDPAPASGPLNFLAYPLLEIDGKPVKAKVEFSFTRKRAGK